MGADDVQLVLLQPAIVGDAWDVLVALTIDLCAGNFEG